MSGHGESASALLDLSSAGNILFGGVTSQAGSTKGTTTQRTKLKISDEAIQKIIADILSGPEGLASIFAGEQTAGIFSSSVSAQAAGDLASKLVGEIAKLTAEQEVVQKVDTTTSSETDTEGLVGGLSDTVGDILKPFKDIGDEVEDFGDSILEGLGLS